MITIKTTSKNKAELNVAKGTPYITMLLGVEMLIEDLMETGCCKNIDDLLCDLKYIYERDNGGKNESNNI